MCLVKIIECDRCFTNPCQIINASTIGELRKIINPIYYTRLVCMGSELTNNQDTEQTNIHNIYYAIITDRVTDILSEYRIM
jgi:hypothetical protein